MMMTTTMKMMVVVVISYLISDSYQAYGAFLLGTPTQLVEYIPFKILWHTMIKS